MILTNVLKNNDVIGIIGTAKNVGKTTVLNECISINKDIAITSIGLDGEEVDQITSLHKPKIKVYKGMVCATAIDTLKSIKENYEVLEHTSISSALGDIVVIKVLKPFNILLAGPANKTGLTTVINILKKYKQKILVDGALYRRSHLGTSCDAIILCVGAVMNSDINQVVLITSMIVDLYQIRRFEQLLNYDFSTSFIQNDLEVITVNHKEDVFSYINTYTKLLYIKGAVTNNVINQLVVHRNELYGKILIVDNPASFICDYDKLQYLKQLKLQLFTLDTTAIKLVCYNPTSIYHYHFDNDEMKLKLTNKINIDVINVLNR